MPGSHNSVLHRSFWSVSLELCEQLSLARKGIWVQKAPCFGIELCLLPDLTQGALKVPVPAFFLIFRKVIRGLVNMETKKMKTILFLLPTYKYISSRCFVCFSKFFFNIKKHYNVKMSLCEGMYITLARNNLSEKYTSLDEQQKKEIDLVVWMDDDVVFGMQQVIGLIEKFESTGLDMLSALCFSRYNKEPMAYTFDFKEKRPIIPLENIRNTGIVKCDAAGFGFLVMKPEVLDKMHASLGKWMFKTPVMPHEEFKEGIYIGEDIYFYMKAKELGITMGVDTDIIIGHDGGVIE